MQAQPDPRPVDAARPRPAPLLPRISPRLLRTPAASSSRAPPALTHTHTHTPCRRRGRTGRRGGARTRPLRPPTAARSVPRVGAGWQGGHRRGHGGTGRGFSAICGWRGGQGGGGGGGGEGEGEGSGGRCGRAGGRGGGGGFGASWRDGAPRAAAYTSGGGGGGGGSDSPAHALTRPPGMTHSRVLRSTTGRGGVAGLLAGQTLACTGGAPSVRNPGMYPRYEFSAWRLATLDRTRRCLGFPRLGTRWCRWTALTYGPGPGNPCHNVATVVILMVRLSPDR